MNGWNSLPPTSATGWPGDAIAIPSRAKPSRFLDPDRYVEADLTEDAELAILDENKQTLSARVARLDTGMAWAEDPPSRTRHLLTNIEIEQGDAESELEVYSNFIVYRSRSETEQDFYVGARRDVLRRVDGAWKIARRKLILDQNVLLAKNVSIFFEAEEFGQWAARRSPLKPEHSEFEGSD